MRRPAGFPVSRSVGAARSLWSDASALLTLVSLGCGGFGTTEPAQEEGSKEEPPLSRPNSGRYAPSTASSFDNNSNNLNSAAGGGYLDYSSPSTRPPLSSTPYSGYLTPQQQPQRYQQYSLPPAHSENSSFTPSSAGAGGFQGSRPSSTHSSSSSRSSWSSQPPLTASKRDQNWEKKRRLWLARQNSSSGRPQSSSSTWSSVQDPHEDPWNAPNPPSPLSKFMHQQAQQQQPPPAAPDQRLGTASSRSGGLSMQQAPAYQVGATFCRAGLSTASSSASSNTSTSRRQPPGGHCQWSPFS
ncbi:hypothetical protein BBJ28_00012853 [Nothophytophthora sp. Chile5]|nr:hypothetical protein BBJ28_00012853 [Nothophytophthora sp. Chile5]